MSRMPKPVGSWLSSSEPLRRLRLDLARQARILQQLTPSLPAEISPHLAAARVKDRELVLYADASAWATRLRFLAPQLLRTVQTTEPRVRSVDVRVALPEPTDACARRARPISKQAAAMIADAGAATTDQALSAALLRLARLGRR